jgi:CRP-like cAMP-binding protein
MTEDSIATFINKVSFFSGFNEAEKQKLVNRTECFEKFSKDDLIFQQGTPGETLYLVVHGKVSLYRLGTVNVKEGSVSLKSEIEKYVADLGAGTIFGEISMLTDAKRNCTARVASPVAIVMKISKKLIDSLNHPTQIKVHQQLLLALATHLDEMNSQYIDLQCRYDQDIAAIKV